MSTPIEFRVDQTPGFEPPAKHLEVSDFKGGLCFGCNDHPEGREWRQAYVILTRSQVLELVVTLHRWLEKPA